MMIRKLLGLVGAVAAVVMLAGAVMISGSLMSARSGYQDFVDAVGWFIGVAGLALLLFGLGTERPK